MERRWHERYLADLEGRLTSLADPERSASGRVSDVSTSGVCIWLGRSFPTDDLVRLDLEDATLYGFVAQVNEESGLFRVGVLIERVLVGDSDLSRIVRAVLAVAEQRPSESPK